MDEITGNTIIRKATIICKTTNKIIRKDKNLSITVNHEDIEVNPAGEDPPKPKIKLIKKVAEEVAEEDKDEEEIIIKPKLVRRIITKKEDTDMDTPQIERGELMSEYSSSLKKNSSGKELSKEEMVEQVERQLDALIKNRSRYNEKEYALKYTTIENLLSKLRLGITFTNLDEMNNKRVKIDKIVLDKKIPQKQFDKKIDLTGEKDNNDPSMGVFKSSKKYFDKLQYLPPPPEIAKLDPKRNKNFGNQPMPPDMLKMINFSR
jgi:hypothetical protein